MGTDEQKRRQQSIRNILTIQYWKITLWETLEGDLEHHADKKRLSWKIHTPALINQ
jgi:hypothetical protein